MPKDENAVPAGSVAPGDDNDTGQSTEGKKNEGGKSDGKILDRFKTPEELAQSYVELEKKLGEQRSEIGDLREQVKKTTAPQKPDETQQKPKRDYDSAREEIEQKISDGEISVPEGLTLLGEITKEQTEYIMEQKFAEYDQKRSADELTSRFINDHPDFIEFDNSGALEDVMKQNPMHDKFSAYYELKGKQEAEAAYERGKEEALRLAKGADGTRSVLSNPGTSTRETPKPKKGMAEREKVDGMLAALAASRTG